MSESKLLSSEAKTMSNGSKSVKQAASTRTRRSWKEIKTTVEFSRKLMFALNTDSPSNIVFGGGQKNCERVYYLGGTRKRDVTIKYIDVASGGSLGEKLVGEVLLEDSYPSSLLDGSSQRQLTKEEQLLRERKRCSFNGITSFCLDQNRQRLVFSENSDLFYFDDFGAGNSSTEKNISTASKGALDVKICPNNADLISYILNDNVYVQDLVSKREFKLTSSADPVKSGVPSYAVQEEFNRYTGYWWQPQQSSSTTYRIVYEEVDDGCVDLIYISPSCESEFGVDTYRYPKAGTKNSRTELRMAEFTFSSDPSGKPTINCKLKRMQKSFYELFSWYEYLVRGEWTPDGQYFWALIYDRLQQRGQSMLIPVEFFVPIDSESHDQAAAMETSSYLDESKHIILLEEQTSDSWINFHNTIYFLNQQSDEKKPFSYVTALEDTGYLHLYLFKLSLQAADLELVTDGVLRSKSLEKIQLTSGDWCVEYNENVNVDEANGLIYFTGYKDPLESHLYVVNYNEPNKIRQLTSNGYSHKITMNKKCNYFITICSNLSTQQKTYVYELSNQRKSVDDLVLKQVAQIVSREELKSSAAATATTVTITTAPSVDAKTSSAELNSYYTSVNSLLGLNLDALAVSNPSLDNNFAVVVQHLFKPPQIFTFTTDDGCKLYGMIYMPHNYEHGNKYPTMLYIYGGPKVQLVNNSYKANKYPRFNILALLGYCVVIIDSRGSDYRGKVFETHLNRKMGTVEISDQVKGLECAARVFNCIDMKRVAIFGWSYGGYMALMGLAQRPDIFKLGISGAPVTTWNLYDTAYTERYMGLPNENRKAYEDGSVLSWAKSFPDEENRLLIIHGMIDENVHFAHTRKLIDALIKENKPYQLQVYPNERHGIRSSDASLHCDINLYSFLEQHL